MTGLAAGVSGPPWGLGGHGGERGAAGGGSTDRGLDQAGEVPQQIHRGAATNSQDSASESPGCSKGTLHNLSPVKSLKGPLITLFSS